jgi:hypothetical protein
MLLNLDWVFYSSVSQLFLPPKIWWEKYSFQCTKKSWVNCIRTNINYKNGGGDGRVWHLLLLEIRTYLHCCFGFAFEISLNTPLNDISLSLSLSLSWVIWGKTKWDRLEKKMLGLPCEGCQDEDYKDLMWAIGFSAWIWSPLNW